MIAHLVMDVAKGIPDGFLPAALIKLVLLSGMTLDDDMIRLSKNAGFDHCVDKGAGPKAIDVLLRA